MQLSPDYKMYMVMYEIKDYATRKITTLYQRDLYSRIKRIMFCQVYTCTNYTTDSSANIACETESSLSKFEYQLSFKLYITIYTRNYNQ